MCEVDVWVWSFRKPRQLHLQFLYTLVISLSYIEQILKPRSFFDVFFSRLRKKDHKSGPFSQRSGHSVSVLSGP